MPRIVLLARQGGEWAKDLQRQLSRRGFPCAVLLEGVEGEPPGKTPSLVLLELDGQSTDAVAQRLSRAGLPAYLPLIALVDRGSIARLAELNVDDFALLPGDADELAARIKRLLKETARGQVITCGDLLVDRDKSEVSLKGKAIDLTFREFQLLFFLASNPGRVFSRDFLLDKVWGYDYFGGDRTVDVHIRRLRSKIEDPTHSFIETVRNIGYRFQPQVVTPD
ncbi:MAG: response regulator transcription factor [Chloroflexi bacterium]|nr:response regulator transcription factor [Chloroflexota bacterium]